MISKQKIIICILILLIVFGFLIFFRNDILKIFYPDKFLELIKRYSDEYSVDKNLILAVIKAESNFKEEAKSDKQAKGLMQIMNTTAKDVVNVEGLDIDVSNIEEEIIISQNNINIGVAYLSMLFEKYQNMELVIASYNAGIGTVDNWIEKGIIKADGSDIENVPYKETNNYVRKVINNYEMYNRLYT